MRSSGRWLALAASLVFIVLAPASAVAKQEYFAIEPSSSMQAQLRGSDGFAISLFVDGAHVHLVATGHDASVQYEVHGMVSKGKIDAKFAGLGSVLLRFHPRGKAHLRREPDGICRGGDSLVQAGVFVGRLDFEGEQDYTSVHATRIKGSKIETEKRICREEGDGNPPASLKAAFLQASSEKDGISFIAFKTEYKSRPALSGASFNATITELRQRGMSILRSIEAAADLDAFSIARSHGHVDAATVTPPAPFTGSATYQQAPAVDTEAWTGSFAGEFPGLGTVSLMGPEFCPVGGELFVACGPMTWTVNPG